MKLESMRVRTYRNVIDSSDIEVDESITCLVGKNESGKTALLHALYSLNPAFTNLVEVDVVRDYPRWRKVRDERTTDLASVAPIQATFELDDDDRRAIAKALPFPLPASALVSAERTYGGTLRANILAADRDWTDALVRSSGLDSDRKAELSHLGSVEALLSALAQAKRGTDKRTRTWRNIESLVHVAQQLSGRLRNGFTNAELATIEQRLPGVLLLQCIERA